VSKKRKKSGCGQAIWLMFTVRWLYVYQNGGVQPYNVSFRLDKIRSSLTTSLINLNLILRPYYHISPCLYRYFCTLEKGRIDNCELRQQTPDLS
jgi:hypothetical protein